MKIFWDKYTIDVNGLLTLQDITEYINPTTTRGLLADGDVVVSRQVLYIKNVTQNVELFSVANALNSKVLLIDESTPASPTIQFQAEYLPITSDRMMIIVETDRQLPANAATNAKLQEVIAAIQGINFNFPEGLALDTSIQEVITSLGLLTALIVDGSLSVTDSLSSQIFTALQGITSCIWENNILVSEANSESIASSVAAIANLIDTGKIPVTEINSGAIKTAVELLSALIVDGKLSVTETNSNSIKIAVEALAAILTNGKLPVVEENSAAIKTATEAVAAIITDAKIPVTEANSSAIKLAVEAIANLISDAKLPVTETNSGSIKTAVEGIKAGTDKIPANPATEETSLLIKALAGSTSDMVELLKQVRKTLESLSVVDARQRQVVTIGAVKNNESSVVELSSALPVISPTMGTAIVSGFTQGVASSPYNITTSGTQYVQPVGEQPVDQRWRVSEDSRISYQLGIRNKLSFS